MGTFVVKGPFVCNITYHEGCTRVDRKNSQGIVSINAWQLRSPLPPTSVVIRVVSFGVYLRFSFPDMRNASNARDILSRSIADLREYVDQKIHRVYVMSGNANAQPTRQLENGMYVSGVEVHDKIIVVKAKRAGDAVLVAQYVRNFFSFQHHPATQAKFEKTQPSGWQVMAALDDANTTPPDPKGGNTITTTSGGARIDYCAITDIDAVAQFITQSKLTYTSHIIIPSTHVVSGDKSNELYVSMHHLRVVDIPHQHPVQLFQPCPPEIPEYAVAFTTTSEETTALQHAARLERHTAAYMACVRWALDKGSTHHPAYSFKHLAPHDPAQFYHSVAPWWPDGRTNTAGVPPCADGVGSY